MTTTISITANGDIDGDGVIMPMDTWHGFLLAYLTEEFPGASITFKGDARSYGGDSHSVSVEDEDGDADYAAERALEGALDGAMRGAYEAACSDETLWEDVVAVED